MLQQQPLSAFSTDQQQQQHLFLQQQQQHAAAPPIVVENLEREVSVLAALPRQVRCCRVVPEQALSMLETLIQRLVQASDDVAAGRSSSKQQQNNNNNNNNSDAPRSGRKGSLKPSATKNNNDDDTTSRPASIVFLERADVWCDLLDEFAQTAVEYSTDMPLTADQIKAHAAEMKNRDENGNYIPHNLLDMSATLGSGSLNEMSPHQTNYESGAFVEGYRHPKVRTQQPDGGDNDDDGNDDDHNQIDGNNKNNNVDQTQSLAVHAAHSDQQSITSKDFPVGAMTRDLSPNALSPTTRNRREFEQQQLRSASNSPSPAKSSRRGGGGRHHHHNRPQSPPRQGEAELHEFLRKSFISSSANQKSLASSSTTSALQQQQNPPLRRALRLKLLVKEKLRDVFVETAQALGSKIKQPKSVFAPPDVEVATRDFRAMQAEASKFAALVVQYRGQLETELNEEYSRAFETVKKAVDAGGFYHSVSDRSRKGRTHKVVTLITDVFLTLSILDAQRADASIDVSRALLALAGLESRRAYHDNALQLATEAAAKLSKLYVKEVTTINEFRQATLSSNTDPDGNTARLLEGFNNLGYSSLSSSISPFRFLCQLHHDIGHGFPAPLEIVSDNQKFALNRIMSEIQKRLQQLVPLRVAAHFNRASELEHKGSSPTECRAEYTAALTAGTSPRIPEFALPPEHPLMVKTSNAVASLVSDSFEKSRQQRFRTVGPVSSSSTSLPPLAMKPSSARNASSSTATATFASGGRFPQPPVSQRVSKTPLAPPTYATRVSNTSLRTQSQTNYSASRDITARMLGGSEVAKKLTLAEVEGVKKSTHTPGWADDTKTAEDDNLKMLKQFGIVPEGTELTKKQRPISSVAHLDDHFVQDSEELYSTAQQQAQNQQQQQAGSSFNNPDASQSFIASGSIRSGVDGSGAASVKSGYMGASMMRKSSTFAQSQKGGGGVAHDSSSALDKNLEEKLSSRQVQILSGVHGLMDSRANTTHQQYEAELDSVIIRCRRAFVQRDRAARVIQCAWRCAVARLEAFNRRQVYYHYLYQVQKAAGSAILSTYRTHRHHEIFKQKRLELKNKRRAIAQMELLQRKAVGTIIRAIKKFMKQKIYEQELMRRLKIKEREKLVKSDIAAAIIQRWWKIIKYEAKYWKERNEEVNQAKLQDALALKFHAAATTIQRVYRGHVGRFEAKIVKTRVTEQRMMLRRSVNFATDTVRTLLLEFRARRNRLELMQSKTSDMQEQAQRKIRGGWMEALERRKMKIVRARAREVALAARRIQCWWRGHLARKELRYKRKVAQTITMVRIRKEWSSLRAAWVIQGAWRIYRARRQLRKLKAGVGREKINATWLMQAVGRAYFVRQNLCRERSLLKSMISHALSRAHNIRDRHVTLLQQFLRPISSQFALRKILEETLAEKVVIWRRLRVAQREDRTAQFFQSVGRGYMLRRDLMPVLRRRARIMAQNRFAAARTIQCAWKSSVARDQLRMMKDSKERNVERQRVWGEVQVQLHLERVDSLGLNEQSSRLSIVKMQREVRKAIVSGFFYEEELLLTNTTISGNTEIAPPSSNQQQSWERPEQQQGTTEEQQPPQELSEGSTAKKKERILRMYDDTDEEEQDEFVQQILSRQ